MSIYAGAHTRNLRMLGGVIGQNFGNFGLDQAQIGGQLNRMLHDVLVFATIGLNALGINGSALAEVERAGLQRDLVGSAPHFSAQCVDLIDEVALGSTADRGVTGHIGNGIEREGKEDGVHTHTRSGESRLHACVPCSDDGNFGRKLHKKYSIIQRVHNIST